MSNADPDLIGKQMDMCNNVEFPAEKLPPESVNHSIAAPSQVVLFVP